jgi:hypothetical protein
MSASMFARPDQAATVPGDKRNKAGPVRRSTIPEGEALRTISRYRSNYPLNR